MRATRGGTCPEHGEQAEGPGFCCTKIVRPQVGPTTAYRCVLSDKSYPGAGYYGAAATADRACHEANKARRTGRAIGRAEFTIEVIPIDDKGRESGEIQVLTRAEFIAAAARGERESVAK